jgi:hypothetical protein
MPDDRGIVVRSPAEIIFSKTSILSQQDKPDSYLISFELINSIVPGADNSIRL